MADTDNKENERPPIGVTPSGLSQIEPTWRTDGYGVRGPQDERVRESVSPTPMSFEASYPHNSGGGSGSTDCPVPISADHTKYYIRGAFFNTLTQKWECLWFEGVSCNSL